MTLSVSHGDLSDVPHWLSIEKRISTRNVRANLSGFRSKDVFLTRAMRCISPDTQMYLLCTGACLDLRKNKSDAKNDAPAASSSLSWAAAVAAFTGLSAVVSRNKIKLNGCRDASAERFPTSTVFWHLTRLRSASL